MLRHAPARSEQTSFSDLLSHRYPLFELAGRKAAEMWLLNPVDLSMADWRDLRFFQLTQGDDSFAGDISRRKAFNDAFASQIGASIAQQSRVEVCHG